VARPKPLTAPQKKTLVAYAKATWGNLDVVPGREVTAPALEAELGREIRRDDYRDVMNTAFPAEKRKGGRPRGGGG
jgi:hypothetical protein